MTMSLASQASALKSTQLKSEVNMALLDQALDLQKEVATELLEYMHIGQNVDIFI
jgi:hypothetical protein